MTISVVIPCFNCEETIEETLASIFSQTSPADEIIVINDGSEDNTEAVLSRYSNRIVVESQPNSGVSATRNKGVALAKSDWIAFCDSDDLWHPNKLEICIRVLETIQEAEFLFHDFTIAHDSKIIAKHSTESKQHSLFPIFRRTDLTIKKIFNNNVDVALLEVKDKWSSAPTYFGNVLYWIMFGNFIQPSTVIVKRNLFMKSGGFDDEFRHAEDTEYFLRLSKTVDYLYIDLPLMTYKIRPQSLLSTSLLQTIENGTRALIKHCVEDRTIYGKYQSRIKRAVANKYSNLGYFYLTELKSSAARASALVAIKYYPSSLKSWTVCLLTLLPKSVIRILRPRKKIFFSIFINPISIFKNPKERGD